MFDPTNPIFTIISSNNSMSAKALDRAEENIQKTLQILNNIGATNAKKKGSKSRATADHRQKKSRA